MTPNQNYTYYLGGQLLEFNKKMPKSKKSTATSKNSKGVGSPADEVDFEEVVIDAFRNKFEFATLGEIEQFITERSGLKIDGERRKIIQKVFADGFYRGCIAVRTSKGDRD